MSAAVQHRNGQLQLDTNPFVAGASGLHTGRPVQTALGELIKQVGLETTVVVVAGSAGSGKTLLLDMAARALSDIGLSVRRIDGEELIAGPVGEPVDVCLIDEADSIPDATWRTLLTASRKNGARTTVFLCRPSSVIRFAAHGRAAVVQLHALSVPDARHYLRERSASFGRNLFTPEASELAINGSLGSPQALQSIAARAFEAAAQDGGTEIALKHVAYALSPQVRASESQNDEPGTKSHQTDTLRVFYRQSKLTGSSKKLNKQNRGGWPGPVALYLALAVLIAFGAAGTVRFLQSSSSETSRIAALQTSSTQFRMPQNTDRSPDLGNRAPQTVRSTPIEPSTTRSIPMPARVSHSALHGETSRPGQTGALVAGDAERPRGKQYGGGNNYSHLTLRVHKRTRVTVTRRNRVLFLRVLDPGDTYRVPNLTGLRISAADGGAIEMIYDGNSTGFMGNDGGPAERIAPVR